MALRTKGETVDEIEGLARHDARVRHPGARAGAGRSTRAAPAATGAARSTSRRSSAIVVAGAGVPVAKHGNRAASSHCGSADLLEALGVKIDLDAAGVERCLAEAGIAFMFAASVPSRRWATRARSAASSASRPSSTSSARSRTRPRPHRAGRRRLGRAHAAADGRGARPPRDAREALPRRGRPRRAHDHRPLDRSTTCGRRAPRDGTSTPREPRARARRGRAISAAATAETSAWRSPSRS